MANKANLANSVLFAPLSDTDTELTVYTGDGALFPAAPFYLTISPKNKWSRKINSEIVLVTAKYTDTFTITRAQKGTTAMEFSYGDLVANGIYKEDLDDLETALEAYADSVADAAVDTAVFAALQAMMPVGFVVTLGVNTNPATLYGFGTWTAIAGRVIVGISGSDTEFDTLNETGGAKSVTLTSAQSGIPSHTHQQRVGNGSVGAILSVTQAYYSAATGFGAAQATDTNAAADAAQAHTNLQPYIVKYVWERTA